MSKKVGLNGYFKIEAFKATRVVLRDPSGFYSPCIGYGWENESLLEHRGSRRVLSDWARNKILDAGLNYAGENDDWLDCCQVGTGSTTPTASDTGLEAHVAGTSNITTESYATSTEEPYYGYKRRTYRFAEGDAAGNLNEVGVGWATTGSYLFCRHLTVNEYGEQATITVLSDEFLDVTYELRVYAPTEDLIGSATIDGITYSTVIRAATVTDATDWGTNIGTQLGRICANVTDWAAYDGALGTVTQNPSGLKADINSTGAVTNLPYNNNSFYRDMVASCGFEGWNLANGIRCIVTRTSVGNFQTQFTAEGTGDTIPKTVEYQCQFKWRISWEERA